MRRSIQYLGHHYPLISMVSNGCGVGTNFRAGDIRIEATRQNLERVLLDYFVPKRSHYEGYMQLTHVVL